VRTRSASLQKVHSRLRSIVAPARQRSSIAFRSRALATRCPGLTPCRALWGVIVSVKKGRVNAALRRWTPVCDFPSARRCKRHSGQSVPRRAAFPQAFRTLAYERRGIGEGVVLSRVARPRRALPQGCRANSFLATTPGADRSIVSECSSRAVLHWVPIGVACDCCNTTATGDDLLRREPGKPTCLRPPASLSPSGERGQLARLSDFTTETLSSAVSAHPFAGPRPFTVDEATITGGER
jgi:hypothetical protein